MADPRIRELPLACASGVDGVTDAGSRFIPGCCATFRPTPRPTRIGYRTARRAQVALAAHLVAEHACPVKPQSLRVSVPEPCGECDGWQILESGDSCWVCDSGWVSSDQTYLPEAVS